MSDTSAAGSSSSGRQPTEQEVVRIFQDRRARLNATWSKITELAAESAEHELVVKALEPMETSRKCFRLVGEVLVERTVGEVMPAVKKHKDNLDTAISTLSSQLETQRKELSEFQSKYNIRIKNQAGEDITPALDDRKDQAKPGAQGVLVSGSS